MCSISISQLLSHSVSNSLTYKTYKASIDLDFVIFKVDVGNSVLFLPVLFEGNLSISFQKTNNWQMNGQNDVDQKWTSNLPKYVQNILRMKILLEVWRQK